MAKVNRKAAFCAAAAAALYALSAPLSKLLLKGVGPVMMAAFLYLGAGLGMSVVTRGRISRNEQKLSKKDAPYTVAMVALDIAAPILLMLGLKTANASNVSLLGNFEIVATALVARFAFGERIDRRLGIAIALVTIASMMLSADGGDCLSMSRGSIFVLLACVCWGVENNCTRRLSAKDPARIVAIKGIFSGTGSLIIAFAAGESLPGIADALMTMALGFVAYGMSIYFYVYAQRHLGAARTSAYYALSPFIGAGISLIIFKDAPPAVFYAALVVMGAGVWLASVPGKILQQNNHIDTGTGCRYNQIDK